MSNGSRTTLQDVERLISLYKDDPTRPTYYHISMYPPHWERFVAYCHRKRIGPEETLAALGIVVSTVEKHEPTQLP